MKKLILLLVVAMTLTLVNCSNETPINQQQTVEVVKGKEYYLNLANKLMERNPGGTGMICSITDDYMHRRVYKDDYGNYYLSFHAIGSPFEFTRKLDDFNEVEKFCTDRSERAETDKKYKEVKRVIELTKIVVEKTAKGQTDSSRDDGFSVICSGTTPASEVGLYPAGEFIVWQDKYGVYYYTLKYSMSNVTTIRMAEQSYQSAYTLC